jgi:hypothetical protein
MAHQTDPATCNSLSAMYEELRPFLLMGNVVRLSKLLLCDLSQTACWHMLPGNTVVSTVVSI